jgi:hypothetical protein
MPALMSRMSRGGARIINLLRLAFSTNQHSYEDCNRANQCWNSNRAKDEGDHPSDALLTGALVTY